MKPKLYMSDDARKRIVTILDKEILDSDRKGNEDLRQILCRIKGELLCC
jgi:hypothetical protein